MDRSVIAKNDVLACVFNGMETTLQQFCLKLITPDDALDIADTAAHDTDLARGLGAEKLQQPDVRRDKDVYFAHAADTRSKVVNEKLIQTLKMTQNIDSNG